MLNSLIIVLSFVSTLPIPQRLIPSWDSHNLRWFCPMLAVSGAVFGLLWLAAWLGLSRLPGLSPILRGFVMMLFTLGLTGGLHIDGLMDTCDAIFSHRDRDTRLRILSDTYSGSFAVMGCVIILLAKTLLFSELLTLSPDSYTVSLIPAYSRLGMAVLLNSLPFAKRDGLAATLGASRTRSHNPFFALLACVLCLAGGVSVLVVWGCVLVLWAKLCVKIFGGITGDLLGAFVEASEVIMLCGVIGQCI